MKTVYHLMWNEQANVMAIAKVEGHMLPELEILDEDDMKFVSYPLDMLSYYGWHDLGILFKEKL